VNKERAVQCLSPHTNPPPLSFTPSLPSVCFVLDLAQRSFSRGQVPSKSQKLVPLLTEESVLLRPRLDVSRSFFQSPRVHHTGGPGSVGCLMISLMLMSVIVFLKAAALKVDSGYRDRRMSIECNPERGP
jgi:hypothetical protein